LSLKNGEEAKIDIDDEVVNQVSKEEFSKEDEHSSIAGSASEDTTQKIDGAKRAQNSDD
jgi:hypothetical protein